MKLLPEASHSSAEGARIGRVNTPIVSDVAHTGLTVADLDIALSMWCDGLGFALERRFDLDETVTAGTTGVSGASIHAATIALGHQRIELLEYTPAPVGRVQTSPAHNGATHIALTVLDMNQTLEVCQSYRWHAVGPPHLMREGPRAGTRIIYLEGPNGGLLELIAPPRQG